MGSILIIGGIGDYFFYQELTKVTLNQLHSLSESQEKRIEHLLSTNYERLDLITSKTQLRYSLSEYLQNNNANDLEKINEILSDTMSVIDDIHSITLFSTDGSLIASQHRSMDIKHPIDEPFFSSGLYQKTFSLDYSHEIPVIYTSGPLIKDGTSLGVVTVESNADSLLEITGDYTGLGKTGETILAKRDENGDAIFLTPLRFDSHAGLSKIIPKNHTEIPITQALLKNEILMPSATDYRGEKVLAVSNYIEEAEWGMVVKMDVSEIYLSQYGMTTILLGICIILSGIMVTSSIVLSERFTRPLTDLRKQVDLLKSGKYDKKINHKNNNELDSLFEAFKELQKALKHNKKITNSYEMNLKRQLLERNELKKAIDQSAAVTITNRDGYITSVNDQFLKISKYSRDEVVGRTHRMFNSKYHTEEFFNNLWKTVLSGKVWTGVIRNKAKDCSFFWIKDTITPLLGEDGKPECFISIWTDITKQKKTQEQLAKAFEALKESDKLKDEFATMVSHELKTPLTPIKFNTEMLLEDGVLGTLNPEQKIAANEIEINATRLEGLITDILYAQKLDMGKMKFNKKSFNTFELIENTRKSMNPLLAEKGVELEIINSFPGEIFSDISRLQQVLENLIKNAVDFVPENNGKITIGAHQFRDFVEFYVKDNGWGIPKNKQEKLFKKFYQADTSHTRKHGGTGLGLVICKGFVEGLGGKIRCESDEGQGTTFFFSVPIKVEVVA